MLSRQIAVTADGRPIDWYVEEQATSGAWKEQIISTQVSGLSRELTVYRASRKTNLIAYDWHGDDITFCPPMWWDLAIGSGACGLGCRSCVDASTWVYTDIGPLRVSQLYERATEREWKVLGYDDNYKPVWTPLIAMAIKPTPATHIRFKLDTGHQVQVTHDHPMIAARPGHFDGWDGNFPADHVVKDDWLPIVQSAPPLRDKSQHIDLLYINWPMPMKVEDASLVLRLKHSTTELAKFIGQKPSDDRRYLISRHAEAGIYDLDEYRKVLQVTGLEPDGDIVIRTSFSQSGLPRYMPLDHEHGFLIGHYLAEGSMSDRELTVSVHKREVNEVLPRWNNLSPANATVQYRTGGNGAAVRVAQATITSLFSILVPGSAFTKRMPDIVWSGPREFAEGIIEGLLYGDGHLDKFGSIIYATCSEGLAADLRLLLWMLGYSPTIVRNNYRQGKVAYQVRIQQAQATTLIRQVRLSWTASERGRNMITHRYPKSLLMKRKMQRLRATTGATRWGQRYEAHEIELSEWGNKVANGGLGMAVVEEITSIEPTSGLVYDLQTSTGNFVAGDGILVHNCFLMLTHRVKRDPMRHLLYDNLEDFSAAAQQWLRDPKRRRQHTLGIGIDRSDSLLYEGVAPHVRNLAPIFASEHHNPQGNKIILLTKSANTHYLADVSPQHRSNIVVSFSLNPESIADLWEGKWPDTGERISPSIAKRLEAVRYAQDEGYEVRVRVDPILTPDGWADEYAQFVAEVRREGINFRYWTLGTYREKNPQLDAWRARWGIPAMEWQPGDDEMTKDGTHRHLPENRRIEIYRTVKDIIRREFPSAKVSLCKETHTVRKAVMLCNSDCNCLVP